MFHAEAGVTKRFSALDLHEDTESQEGERESKTLFKTKNAEPTTTNHMLTKKNKFAKGTLPVGRGESTRRRRA